jgi:hypothetical protein
MKKFYLVLGLSTALAGAVGGCATVGGTGEAPGDAYATGKQHFSAGRLGLALEDFQTALQEQGPSVDRLNALAATYDRLARFDLADRIYRQALALDPNAPQTLNNIGYSYMLRGRPDLAAAYLARAQSVAKSDPVIGANLARVATSLQGGEEVQPVPAAPEPVRQAEARRPAPQPSIPQPATEVAKAEMPAAVASATSMPVERPAVTLASLPRVPVAAAPIARPLTAEQPVAQVTRSSLTPAPRLISAPAPSAVQLLTPQNRTMIQPVAKGVFELVTVRDEDTGASAQETAPAVPTQTALSASFEIPRVIEPMPAIAAVPVAAVQSEPLERVRQVTPAAGTATISGAPLTAGIILAAATGAEQPFAAEQAGPETRPAINADAGLYSGALIEVSNGSGIERSGARFRAYLSSRGVPVKRLTNDAQFGHAETILYYRNGFAEAAQAIASELAMPVTLERDDRQRSDLRLRLGLDSKWFDDYLAAGILTASR